MSDYKILQLNTDKFDARYATKDAPNVFSKTNKFGSSTNYTQIDSEGHQTLVGDATVYDDMQVSINNVAKGVAAPTNRLYAYGVGSGITFNTLGFAKNDYIYFDVQTSHSMQLNSILDCHIHFTLPDTTTIGHKIVWKLDVLASGINRTWAVPTGSPFTATHTVVADDNTKHRILNLADIPAVNTTVSSIYKCKLTRIDGTATEYAGEVYISYIDCHYIKDTLGSNEQTTK